MIKIILFFSLLNNLAFANSSDSLSKTSKEVFDKAKPEYVYRKDDNVKKKNATLKVSNCLTLKDNNSDKNFYEFNYIGDIDTARRFRIVRKTLYNGEEYRIIDVLNKCRVYDLLGLPHTFGKVIINFNESETTDKKKVIEIWQLNSQGIVKLKNVFYKKKLSFSEVRSLDESAFIIKDIDGMYWKIAL